MDTWTCSSCHNSRDWYWIPTYRISPKDQQKVLYVRLDAWWTGAITTHSDTSHMLCQVFASSLFSWKEERLSVRTKVRWVKNKHNSNTIGGYQPSPWTDTNVRSEILALPVRVVGYIDILATLEEAPFCKEGPRGARSSPLEVEGDRCQTPAP